MAVYALHLLIALFGPVRRVSAMQAVTVNRRSWGGRPFFVTAPDNVIAQLDFGNGLLASVGAQWCEGGSRAHAFQFGIYGLDGSIESSEYLGAWATACDLRREGEVRRITLEPADFSSLTGAHGEFHPHIWADILHLLACIQRETDPLAGVVPARHVMEILQATAAAANPARRRCWKREFRGPGFVVRSSDWTDPTDRSDLMTEH